VRLSQQLRALVEAAGARAVQPRSPQRNPRPERLTVEDAKRKYGRYLQPPWYLIDPARIPFPDSVAFWWAGVARMATEGRIVKGGKPNYEQAMRHWKNQVKRHYGYRPKRTRHQSMMEGIRAHLKAASRRMGLEKQKPAAQQRAGRVTMAAKLIRSQATQKKAAKQLAAQGQAAQRSAAAKKGHETRKLAKAAPVKKRVARKPKTA
jgi:hypothetical protein